MIIIESKRKKPETILKKYPEAILADVTSGAKNGLVKLSPFYPHYGIPVPFSEGYTATCVEAIWQGLKVFEGADVDTSLFRNDTMKGLKRTVRRFGKPLGHRMGVNGTELLGYIEARKLIYIPTYRWVLENKVPHIIERLKAASEEGKTIVLLDYDTNADVENAKKPLSVAAGKYTRAHKAFALAKGLLDKWMKEHHEKDCYPPTIINITDGFFCGMVV